MNYVINGEEKYLIKKQISKICDDVLGKDHDEMNIINYDAEKADIQEIITDCNTIPFLCDQKVIILNNVKFLGSKAKDDENLDLLINYLEKPNLSTTLILLCEGNIDSRKKIVKTIKKMCKFLVFNAAEEYDRNQFINARLKQYGVTLEKDAYRLYLKRSTNDFAIIDNDIQKLALYSNYITAEDIKALICKPVYDDEQYKFVFIQALYDKNAKLLFNIYNDFKALNVETLALIGLIESQFRFLLQVKTLRDLGYSEKSIANELNAKPYRIKKTLENASNFSSDKIGNILDKLAKLDQGYKKGEIDINLGFELFLVNECRD